MFKNRTFRFSHEITVLSILAAALCFSMSYWQNTRYIEKKGYFQVVEKQEALGRQTLDPKTAHLEELSQALISTSGRFDHEQTMVIINRSAHSTAGVKLVTPLILESGEAILVDRGFYPYGAYEKGEHKGLETDETLLLEGILRPSQTKAFAFSPPASGPKKPGEENRQERWLRLEVEAMASQIPYSLLPVYIEQTNQTGEYPLYDKKEILSPGRHLNYVIQWASFGGFSIFFGLFLQFRPKRKRSAQSALEQESAPIS